MNIPQLVAAVIDWASARNLINGSEPKTQTLKTVSEFGELAKAMNEGQVQEVKDGIGDVLVTCIIAARQLGADLFDSNKDFIPGVIVDAQFKAAEFRGHEDTLGDYMYATIAVGVMADNVIKGQPDEYAKNFRHLCKYLAKIACSYDTDLNECLAFAYDDIKDRTGVMYNGVFIKSTDERYAGAVSELGLDAGEPA